MRKLVRPSAYLGTIAMSLLTMVVGLVVAPTQAQAAAVCPSGDFCLYENINMGGGILIFTKDDPDLSDNRFSNGDKANDAASSMVNHTTHSIDLFQDSQFRTKVYT